VTDRAAFEAWFSAKHWPDPRDWDHALKDQAWAEQVGTAWEIWRAAIKAEREACAKVCEDKSASIGLICAAAIRARGET
jgi:hypothetical protein